VHADRGATVELWRAGGAVASTSAVEARAVEADGWDGQMFMDSQSLGADPWVLMGAWALATERLRLATGVTNTFTRHLAVTAASAASVQALSGGRAVLGVGRGDSGLAYLGRGPVRLGAFARALRDLQRLLGGEEVAFAADGDARGEAPSLDTLSLGARPAATALRWLPEDLPKVPLDVAATGPRVIELAAPLAERVTFSVGAIPERIKWAIDIAHASRARHGLTDADVSYGAQLVVVCHTDAEAALEVATEFTAPLARFQVIQGRAAGPQEPVDADGFAAIRRAYDMTKHGRVGERRRLIGTSLAPEFVRRFAVVGPPDHCIERLLELIGLGIDRLFVVGPGFYPSAWGDARGLFVREVMPALRAERLRSPAPSAGSAAR
jgi:5,10-methylenetetrahydromethanopterin reductase